MTTSIENMRAIAASLDSPDSDDQNRAIDQLLSISTDSSYETAIAAIDLCCAGLRQPSSFARAAALHRLFCDLLPRLLRKTGTYAGADLRRAEFSSAMFDECDLPAADFAGARFGNGTSFLKSKLVGARMTGAVAELETVFAAAQLPGARLAGLCAPKANFVGADLSHADFSTAQLREANFGVADAPGAVFVGADLSGADLSGMDLRGANLAGAKLDGAELNEGREERITDLRGANLAGASFNGARLIRADLRGANLAGVNLEFATIVGAELHGAILADTKISSSSVLF